MNKLLLFSVFSILTLNVMAQEKIVQTAGRDQLGTFAPKFAELNDDVLFGEVWSRTDKLGLRDRSLVTITSLISMGITDNSLVYHLQSAKKNGITNAQFFCNDAGRFMSHMAASGESAYVVFMDPPRSGSTEEFIDAVALMQPKRVVYISCGPDTLARDLKIFAKHGYRAKEAWPVDLFGWTGHVETVVLLSKGEVDSKKIRVEFSLEDMDMSEFQDGATYTQIKDYVLEHSGLKVSNLYISQIKRKCGIEVGKNYNFPKSEDSRQPMCPPEKEKAIREAFKYFGMI